MKKAMVVFSGGQDSTTCLYWALDQFEEVQAVIFNYGQKHAREIDAAAEIARRASVKCTLVVVGPILAGRSPLTNPDEQLETYEDFGQMDKVIGDRVEPTFVPMRNALFLTLAINRAVAKDIFHIVTGVCQADNANYPDCRLDFILAQMATANLALGLESGKPEDMLCIHTPLMHLPKADTVMLARTLPGCYEALAYSHTAYSGEYPPVTQDHATVLRAHGFKGAGIPDPLICRAFWEMKLHELPDTANYRHYAQRIIDLRLNDVLSIDDKIRDLALSVGARVNPK